MDNYIKTIINGLKTWVSSCLSRLETSVSGSLEVAEKAQATAEKAQATADSSISEARVNELIDEKLGAIENGSY